MEDFPFPSLHLYSFKKRDSSAATQQEQLHLSLKHLMHTWE